MRALDLGSEVRKPPQCLVIGPLQVIQAEQGRTFIGSQRHHDTAQGLEQPRAPIRLL